MLQGVPFDWGWNSWGLAQAWRQWQKQLQKSYLENFPWLEKLHTHQSYDQQGLLFHEKEELPWSPSKAWNSQNLIGDHLPAVGWFQKRLSLVQWHCALKILAVSQACTKTKLQGMLHELAQSACQFLVAPPWISTKCLPVLGGFSLVDSIPRDERMKKKEISMKYFLLSSILCFALPMDTNCHGFYVVVIKR